MNFIEKLQKKSRSSRILIMWLASFLIMAIVILIWLSSFSRSLNPKEIKKETEKTSLPSLFESLRKDFSIFKQNLKANIKDINLDLEKQNGEQQKE